MQNRERRHYFRDLFALQRYLWVPRQSLPQAWTITGLLMQNISSTWLRSCLCVERAVHWGVELNTSQDSLWATRNSNTIPPHPIPRTQPWVVHKNKIWAFICPAFSKANIKPLSSLSDEIDYTFFSCKTHILLFIKQPPLAFPLFNFPFDIGPPYSWPFLFWNELS